VDGAGLSFDNKLPFAGQMAVYCQNLPIGALSSRSAPSVLVGAIFKSSVFF